MKPLNPIERAAFDAMNEWRRRYGLHSLKDPDDDQHLGDEEPRRPKRDIDKVLDDPRRGQAAEINKLR